MIKDSNKRITVTLTKEEIKALETKANKTGLNKSILIKLAIQRYLNEIK